MVRGPVIDYDQRYRQGYMADFGDLYEACRLVAIRQTLHSRRLFPVKPNIAVDIACGQGRYSPVIKEAFPTCQIVGIDISSIALELAIKRFPEDRFIAAACESLPLADDAVDMVFSIETLEHVSDVRATIQEWGRVLKPGGRILFTTPCANKFSLEWFMMYFTGGLQPTEDGIGRFRRDEPAHLRRLSSRHIKEFFAEVGLQVIYSRFRTHFFTTVAHDFLFRRFPRFAYRIASLDWRLLRKFPNGASMLVVGEKIAI
jgi:ubiquinone/menaquinone biosynthesis C-methylase UbiE